MILRTLARIPSFVFSLASNRLGRPVRPRILTYTVAMTCNLRCAMCDSWRIVETPKDWLSAEQLRGIFSYFPRMDAVRLTGGEPFVRKDLLEVTEIVLEMLDPLRLHITTNGLLTERIIELCERRPQRIPLDLLISIDGTEPLHNEIRGVNRSFERAMATVSALAPRRRELNLTVAVNQTITERRGIEARDELEALLSKLGVPLLTVIAYRNSATYSLERGSTAENQIGRFEPYGDLRHEDIAALQQKSEGGLATLPAPMRLAKRFYLDTVLEMLSGGGSFTHPRCAALGEHLRLLPTGDVPTCQMNGTVVGNLTRQTLPELLASESWKRQREWVKACAGCPAECELLPSAVVSGELFLPKRLRRKSSVPHSVKSVSNHSSSAGASQ